MPEQSQPGASQEEPERPVVIETGKEFSRRPEQSPGKNLHTGTTQEVAATQGNAEPIPRRSRNLGEHYAGRTRAGHSLNDRSATHHLRT